MTCQNLAVSTPRGILTPCSPGGSNLANVRPVCLPSLASSNVPSVITVTSKRSLCLGGWLCLASHSKKGISLAVPISTAATAMGSCRGGPAVMPKVSLKLLAESAYVVFLLTYAYVWAKKYRSSTSMVRRVVFPGPVFSASGPYRSISLTSGVAST